MDQQTSNAGLLVTPPWMKRRTPRSEIFEHLLRKCENPHCAERRSLWPFAWRGPEGARLQGRWYCSGRCFEQAALDAFLRVLSTPDGDRRKSHRIPIGLLLLSRGLINESQLKEALSRQRKEGGGPIGGFLQKIEAISEQDLTVGLAAQWGCPVYPLDRDRGFLDCATLVPTALMETGRMLPVHIAVQQKMLYLGFVRGIDRTTLYSVEQMLQFRTVPCIVAESALETALGELHRSANSTATIFESVQEPLEMARTTHSYALQLQVSDVWMARSGRFVWVRLFAPRGVKDILFQIVTPSRLPGL